MKGTLPERIVAALLPPAGLLGATPGLGRGVSSNLLAFVVIGVSGILLNLSIAFFYNAETLGIFNTILAIYIISGQLAAAGLQYSTLYYVSVNADSKGSVSVITVVALCMALSLSILVCLSIVLILTVMDISESFDQAVRFSLPGLFLFPLNKIMMASLNGQRRTGTFALFNAGRVALILIASGIAGMSGVAGPAITGCLSAAEIIVFAGLAWSSRFSLAGATFVSAREWLNQHVRFASRTVLGGLLNELNSRVDILCLSALTSPTVVGIYSVGSMFAEGLLQLLMVLRINVDPLLARFSSHGRADQLAALISWTKLIAFWGMAVTGIAAIALYPVMVPFVVDWQVFADSWVVFAILIGGIMGAAPFIPLYGIFQHSNHPLRQTVFLAQVTSVNILFNVLFVLLFGMIGAALATALAFLCSPIIMRRLARKVLLVVP